MFERNLWNEAFSEWPTWPCPTCNSVAVTLEGKTKIISDETGPSIRAQQHEAWDPEWIEKRFAALLKCHNPACGELIAVAGRVSIEEALGNDEMGEPQQQFADTFKPSFFEAAPPIFVIPDKCPAQVRLQLISAFALIWSDTAAAASRMRAGVEALLDDQGIAKTTISKARKREWLTTHSRIESLKKSHKEAAEYLMAIKWLGNTGTHTYFEGLERKDILDAATLFEAAIERLYLKKDKEFERLAAAINKRKGKPRRRREKSPF